MARGFRLIGLLSALAACSGASPTAADGGDCAIATDCPEIDCQCAGGGTVSSYCICQGGITASGKCGTGAVCAQANDCTNVCAAVNGPSGPGSTTGAGSSGGSGQPCESQAQCGAQACRCDAGVQNVQTYCLQGLCSCPGC
jgi:hypothetical protein